MARFPVAVVHSDNMPAGVNVAMKTGESRRVSGTEVQVTFADVPEHSRCPPRRSVASGGR